MEGLGKKAGFTYTRYADDLVLSHPDANAAVGKVINCTRTIIAEEGLEPGPDR